MSNEKYPKEVLDESVDDGTILDNVADLADEVVGHRIVAVEKVPGTPRNEWTFQRDELRITLDNGTVVCLHETDDCCAYTELESFLLHADKIDHIITGVGTTEECTVWHIYADAGDVLELKVGWSAGNPFYYGYGFLIGVKEAGE